MTLFLGQDPAPIATAFIRLTIIGAKEVAERDQRVRTAEPVTPSQQLELHKSMVETKAPIKLLTSSKVI